MATTQERKGSVMGVFVMAWLVGEGIIIYRSIKVQKAPPGPGQLLLSSGVFVLLALLAEAEQARPLATTLAWGFDIAAFMNIAGLAPKAAEGQAGKWPPDKLSEEVILPGTPVPPGAPVPGKNLPGK